MEKENFHVLVQHYTSLTREEATELISLQEKFPYSQVIHNLCSRAAQDHEMDLREQLLHRSAIYTTERTVLKSVMTAPKESRVFAGNQSSAVVTETPTPSKSLKEVPHEVTIVATSEQKPVAKTENAVVKKATSESFASRPVKEETIPDLGGDALISDLLLEIDKLRLSQKKFEASVVEFDKSQLALTDVDAKKKTKKASEPEEPADTLIEEIKTKKKVKPDGPKQKEQIEIIENFIKTQPTISKNKIAAPPADPSDLAEKSLLYGDNIVSETLVGILLKQGKKDKAIEVLKKLIWKFPQKKAYFAAQIEDLKK